MGDTTRDEGLRFLGFDDLDAQEAGPLAAGEVLGEYRVEERIGRGSFGTVYRARHASLARTVALKVFPAGGDDPRRARRQREARLLARLDHEAVVRVYDAGVERGMEYVAMQLVEGGTLRDRMLHGGARDLAGSVELLARVADGLAAAHEAGILHRDVKPENVLLDGRDRPLLADFGLARGLDPEETMTAGFAGTPAYASPEQLRGEAVCPSSDVFSFGALAFELVTGTRPFGRGGPADGTEATLYADPAWPRGQQPPRELVAIIERCLAKVPRERYLSGSELAADLERLRRFEPVEARRRGAIARAVARARLRPRRVLARAGVASLAVLCTVAVWFALRDRGDLGEARAELSVAAAMDAFHSGRLAEAISLLEATPGGAEVETLLTDVRIFEEAARFERRSREESELPDGYVPQTPWEHGRVGEDAMCRGDAALADRHLSLAVEAQPTSYVWRLLRGCARLNAGRTHEAEVDFAIASALQPLEPAPRAGYHDALVMRGEHLEALEKARAARALLPDDPWIAVILTRSLVVCGLGDEALEVIREAYRLHPDNRRVVGRLLDALLQMGRPDEAETMLASLSPELRGLSDSLSAEADIAIARSDWEVALNCASRLREKRGWAARGAKIESDVYAARGDHQAARETLEELCALQPSVTYWWVELGKLHAQQARHQEAIASLTEALELDPNSALALLSRGASLRALGRYEDALVDYTRALGSIPDNAWPPFHLAETWLDLDQPAAALIFIDRSIAVHSGWFDAHALRAECLWRLRRWDEAAQALEETLSIREDAEVRKRYEEALRLRP
ncbi:MAG: protein kinase [Planctomycetota bacterium]